MNKIIELDGRRRTSLAKIGKTEHTRYAVEDRADGTIVLTPAVTIPLDLVERLRAGIEASQRGEGVKFDDLLAELGTTREAVLADDD